LGKFIPKITNVSIFCGVSPHLYQKLPVSAILEVISPHFKSDSGEICPENTDLRYPPRV